MTRPCGATQPAVHDAGWECNGTGLVVVMVIGSGSMAGLPIVLPARALEIVEPEAWWETPLQRFAGGDHLHMVVPRCPPTRG